LRGVCRLSCRGSCRLRPVMQDLDVFRRHDDSR
jgi:hypothetical protein